MNTDRTQSEAAFERTRELHEWMDQQAIKEEAMKAELAKKHGIPRDEKFEKAWGIAWGWGHHSGLSEVRYCFEEIVELIKP